MCGLADGVLCLSAQKNGGNDPQKGGQTIAIYHCSIKIISRGKGKSAVAAAAYRAGEKLTNDFDGETHDYTHKGGVVHTEILLPGHAPAAFSDRAVLWNAVEKIEKAKNAQLAREIEIALPRELTREQGISLVREYVKEQFVNAGMCADFAIHDTGGGNPHAHIMLTKEADRGRANPIHGGARLSERRDERQDRPAGKGMESGVCQADRRKENAQSAVSCFERGGERSRENQKERLQYLAAGTAGAAAPQGAGHGAVTRRAAG